MKPLSKEALALRIGEWFRKVLRKDRNPVSLSGAPVYVHDKHTTRPFGRADVPEHWAGLRSDHYEQWLGPASTVYHEVIPQIPHIDVEVHPPCERLGRDYFTLITNGMSDLPMHLPDGVDASAARAEILMYVAELAVKPYSTEASWEVELLRFLAMFPFEYETWLAEGHTLPNGDPPQPFVPGSLLTTSFLMESIFEPAEFREGLTLDGAPVNLLWLNPLTEAECNLKLRQRVSALYDLMDKAQLPKVLDVKRRSMV
jgi:hypothetical protein